MFSKHICALYYGYIHYIALYECVWVLDRQEIEIASGRSISEVTFEKRHLNQITCCLQFVRDVTELPFRALACTL